MCGIVGYIGSREATPLLLDALKRLEYRGYDSAGIAVLKNKKIKVHKLPGEIRNLERSLPKLSGKIGIAHTRWATHGNPTRENAHPHLDCRSKIAVIHNGIIENFDLLRRKLSEKGHRFVSDTDTEVIPHLLEENYRGNPLESFQKSMEMLHGSYAIAAIFSEHELLLAARKDSPLVIGFSPSANWVASDIPALLKFTRRIAWVEDGEIVLLTRRKVEVGKNGKVVRKKIENISWKIEDAEKAGYPHFMLKEIHEQPRTFRETISGRIGEIFPAKLDLQIDAKGMSRMILTACGTSYHAALFGKYLCERLAGIPAEASISSEFRYSHPPLGSDVLVVAISQSGETADTLAALRAGKECRSIAITNVVGSSITREAEQSIYTYAGPEIGVAATKSFLSQLAILYLLTINLAILRGNIGLEEAKQIVFQLKKIPGMVQDLLDAKEEIRKLARKFYRSRNLFFIGRNLNYPIALEGALKMKEIAYIPCEGYPSGELKHGPLALLGKDVPVVAIVGPGETYEKILGNIKEIKARDASVIAIAEENDREIEKFADFILKVPSCGELLFPLLATVAVQLFAYYVAYFRKCSIDKPRNLAKSVTVE